MMKIRSKCLPKTDALNEYLRYTGRIQAETATKKYWRLQRWITSARMSEGEDVTMTRVPEGRQRWGNLRQNGGGEQ